MGIEKEFVEGMQFDQGYISQYFVTDAATMRAVYDRPYVLITDKKISSIQEILPLLEALAQKGRKELVIICENIEGEALPTLVLNKLRGTFSTLAIKAPAFGDRRKEILKDIAALTGARVISEEVGLKLETASVNAPASSFVVKPSIYAPFRTTISSPFHHCGHSSAVIVRRVPVHGSCRMRPPSGVRPVTAMKCPLAGWSRRKRNNAITASPTWYASRKASTGSPGQR
jgi:hypothetical protein